MKIKKVTFYETTDGKIKSHNGVLKLKTLKKFGAVKAYIMSIDSYAPSKGFFNRQELLCKNNNANDHKL